MALNSIKTNIAAYYAQANIGKASSNASSSISRLSSGSRIVQASDDVAALSVGTALRTVVTTLRMALLNANQGTSMLQVADGALGQVTDILQRQKAIAVQASSGSLTSSERGFLNQEFQALASQIDQIAANTNFNGVTLLNGGLGTKSKLANLDALAALFDPTAADLNTAATAVASTTAIEAFNVTDGSTLNGAAAPGALDIVDSANAVLADGAYENVNSAVYGAFSSFKLSDAIYGVSAKLTATINGVEFTGTVLEGGTTATVSNGSTNILLAFTAVTTTDDGTLGVAQTQINADFKNTRIAHTVVVQGVDFSNTRLQDAVGAATTGNAMARVYDPTRLDISNFQYAGNTAAADTNILTVQVNGQVFTASGVLDNIDDATGTILVFDGGDGQALYIDITGLTANATNPNTAIGDIRTNIKDRTDFINALNVGFSKAGGGLNFNVGTTSSDNIGVNIRATTTVSLYNGQTLSVATAADAAAASDALDIAIKTVTAVRADVGALQSRFNFASANVENAIQNQDAARGVLLDTDVAFESTAFANAQVQLQAGIAVLAQSNLLPQNLLKLIG